MTSLSYQALGVTAFLAQPSLESQVEYLRSRFSNIRLKEFFLDPTLLYPSLIFVHFFFIIISSFYIEVEVSNCLIL